ncbi:MAG: hypothetical protein HYX75_23180 [Acidobacteria bacterium]|nr:hypothetical protein [Acidobacteriota bacterium]
MSTDRLGTATNRERYGAGRGKPHGQEVDDGERTALGSADTVFLSTSGFWLLAGGALGALAAFGAGKAMNRFRPQVVGAVKEGYAFKEWIASKVERAKEDVEDIAAEARHGYHSDLVTTVDSIRREQEILRRAEEAIEKRMKNQRSSSDTEQEV